MDTQSADEAEMAEILVGALNLETVAAADIPPQAPLFGYNTAQQGLGLDSIDALEIALAIQQRYGVKIRSEDPEVKSAFASLRNLSAYVKKCRAA